MNRITQLAPKVPFSFKGGSSGRTVNVLASDRFETMTTSTYATTNGHYLIARRGKGKLGIGWAFSPEQIEQLFTVES